MDNNSWNKLGPLWERGMWLDKDGNLRGKCTNSRMALKLAPLRDVDTTAIKNGSYMFFKNQEIAESKVDFPNLTDGQYMFSYCANFASFVGNLPNLQNGTQMFSFSNLKNWDVALPELTNGSSMFSVSKMEEWHIALPKLVTGNYMFYSTPIVSWSIDLPRMTSASQMFRYCSKLKFFRARLDSLSSASYMFELAVLDPASILYILQGDGPEAEYQGIPTYTSGSHPLHLGKRKNFMYSQEVADCFDEKPVVDAEHPLPAATYHCKGWTITVTA